MLIRTQNQQDTYNSDFLESIKIDWDEPDGGWNNRHLIIGNFLNEKRVTLAMYDSRKQAESEYNLFFDLMSSGYSKFTFAQDGEQNEWTKNRKTSCQEWSKIFLKQEKKPEPEDEDEKKEMKNLLSKLIINILYDNSKKKDKQEEEKL